MTQDDVIFIPCECQMRVPLHFSPNQSNAATWHDGHKGLVSFETEGRAILKKHVDGLEFQLIHTVVTRPGSKQTLYLKIPIQKKRYTWEFQFWKIDALGGFLFPKIDALGSSFSENRCTWVLARKNRCTLGARAIDFLRSRQGDHSLTTTRLWRHPVLHTATRHHSQVFRPWAVVAAAAAATTSLLISFGRARACQPPGAACLSHTFQLFHNFAKGFIAESASFSD